MTTFEIPALVLPSRWRMLGALEAVNGVLLFGISSVHFRGDSGLLADALSPVDVQKVVVTRSLDGH